MSQVVFASMKMPTAKTKPEVDADGYYKVSLGAFNVPNSIGEVYPFTPEVEALLAPVSYLSNKISSGYLYSENDHPILEPGMSAKEYIQRISRIDQENLIGQFKSIEIVKSNKRSSSGDVIYYVVGWVKPFGTHKEILQQSLDDDTINTAFSLRCLFKYGNWNGARARLVFSIITWDFVLAPGIKTANKFSMSAGLEDEVMFSEEALREAIASLEEDFGDDTAGLESEFPMLDGIKKSICGTGNCLYEW